MHIPPIPFYPILFYSTHFILFCCILKSHTLQNDNFILSFTLKLYLMLHSLHFNKITLHYWTFHIHLTKYKLATLWCMCFQKFPRFQKLEILKTIGQFLRLASHESSRNFTNFVPINILDLWLKFLHFRENISLWKQLNVSKTRQPRV
jgi:hypothetical protein